MKLLPLACLTALLLLGSAPARAESEQQLLSSAQTAFMRGDLVTAKREFQAVNQMDPRNQVAINYLRMIKIQEAQAPKGNDQEKMLSTVIIPKIEFREATLGAAIEFLRQAVAKASNGQQSVNFVVNLPEEQVKTQPVTLVLANIPFTEAVKYLGDLANIQFTYEKYAIKVTPKGGAVAPTASVAPAAQ